MILHNDAVDAILTRRSIRSYQAKQISEDALETILTAGQYAPSGMNQQSAKAIVVQSKERMQQLVQLAKAAEQVDHNPFYDAPTVILVFARCDPTRTARRRLQCTGKYDAGSTRHRFGQLLDLCSKGAVLNRRRCCVSERTGAFRNRSDCGFDCGWLSRRCSSAAKATQGVIFPNRVKK